MSEDLNDCRDAKKLLVIQHTEKDKTISSLKEQIENVTKGKNEEIQKIIKEKDEEIKKSKGTESECLTTKGGSQKQYEKNICKERAKVDIRNIKTYILIAILVPIIFFAVLIITKVTVLYVAILSTVAFTIFIVVLFYIWGISKTKKNFKNFSVICPEDDKNTYITQMEGLKIFKKKNKI